jgi:hypothetical protein
MTLLMMHGTPIQYNLDDEEVKEYGEMWLQVKGLADKCLNIFEVHFVAM